MQGSSWSALGLSERCSQICTFYRGIFKRFFKISLLLTLVGTFFVSITQSAYAQKAIKPDAKILKFWNDYESESPIQVNHDDWQSLLTTYVDDAHPSGINRFDYASVSYDDRQKLQKYIDYLQLMEPRQLNLNESKAFWLNLYNATIVNIILEALDKNSIDSIQDLSSGRFSSGPWKRKVVEVVFQKLSLNDIEHNIIRPVFKDTRMVFAMSKGSLGGGDLLKTAFNGDNNEELLDKAQQDYLNHDRGISIIDGNRARLSSIFDWYSKDFGENRREIMQELAKLVGEDKREYLLSNRRVSYEYDWALNSK